MHYSASRSWWLVGCCLLPICVTPVRAQDDGLTDDPLDEAVAEVVYSDRNVAVHPYEHVHHAYAQVLNVQPAYEIPVPQATDCSPDTDVTDGDGSPADEAESDTILSVSSALAAMGFDDAVSGEPDGHADNDCDDASVVDDEPVLVGYDVEYRYRGEVFVSRLNAYPGDRLRIRVAIAPIEPDGGGVDTPDPDEVGLPDDSASDVPQYPTFH